MTKPRSKKNKDLEKYVIRNSQGYVRYKHPAMPNWEYFGKDVDAANEVARICNQELSNYSDRIQRILDGKPKPRKIKTDGTTTKEVIERFIDEYVPELDWSDRYAKEQNIRFKKFIKDNGHVNFQSIEVDFLADYLDNNFKGEGYRISRSLWNLIYTFAIGKGLRKGTNVALETLAKKKKKRVRKRIKDYQEFLSIRKQAPLFLQLAMDISLISLQARQEVANMKIEDIQDGYLYVIRNKTVKKTDKAFIKIKIGNELQNILDQCKEIANKIDSPFLINHIPEMRRRSYIDKKEYWTQVLPEYITRSFKKAVQATDHYDEYNDEQLPTFHEIRSLGGRIYEELGFSKESIQSLYAHTNEKMTAHYLSGDVDAIYWHDANAQMSFENVNKLKMSNGNDQQ